MKSALWGFISVFIFTFLLFTQSALSEDVIKLVDGGEVRGTIIEENPYEVKIQVKSTVVVFAREEIASIKKGFDFNVEFKNRHSNLPKNDADALFKLGVWCEENKHDKEAKECFEEAIKIDSNHSDARDRLGFKKYKSEWYTEENYYKEIGWTNYGGIWMPVEDKEKYEVGLVKRDDGKWVTKEEWDEEQKHIKPKPKPKPVDGKEVEEGDDSGDPAAEARLRERENKNPIPEKINERKAWIQEQLKVWRHHIESEHYIFLTNAPPDAARNYAKMMDKVYEEYCKIFGYKEKQKVPFLVHLHANQQEFMQVNRVGRGVGGFYDGSRIVCFMGSAGGLSLQTVLMHEGTHQFQGLIGPDMMKLTRVPGGIWMIEGLATYFECSEFDGGKIVIGLINKGRIGVLRNAMVTNRYVTLPSLVRMTQVGYGSFHYAHGWGACYFFIHADKKLLSRFKKYFMEFKKSGVDPVASFYKIICTGDFDETKLNEAWRKYIIALSTR
ncbi:MAG: DUF1570 domain-containing protein [Planctomycetota bacterium]